MKTPKIDSERLWSSLMALARIGATPKGGERRVTLTAADREGVMGSHLDTQRRRRY